MWDVVGCGELGRGGGAPGGGRGGDGDGFWAFGGGVFTTCLGSGIGW